MISFDNVRLLKVTARRGEDFDADLQFVNGAIVVHPKRAGADQVSVPYRELQRATYARDPNPKWVVSPTLATPPTGLDVPGVGIRSRRWLVLQGANWYIILSLHEANWQQVLNTVTERTRVKIEESGPSKNE
jgi:hypothetical protein